MEDHNQRRRREKGRERETGGKAVGFLRGGGGYKPRKAGGLEKLEKVKNRFCPKTSRLNATQPTP